MKVLLFVCFLGGLLAAAHSAGSGHREKRFINVASLKALLLKKRGQVQSKARSAASNQQSHSAEKSNQAIALKPQVTIAPPPAAPKASQSSSSNEQSNYCHPQWKKLGSQCVSVFSEGNMLEDDLKRRDKGKLSATDAMLWCRNYEYHYAHADLFVVSNSNAYDPSNNLVMELAREVKMTGRVWINTLESHTGLCFAMDLLRGVPVQESCSTKLYYACAMDEPIVDPSVYIRKK